MCCACFLRELVRCSQKKKADEEEEEQYHRAHLRPLNHQRTNTAGQNAKRNYQKTKRGNEMNKKQKLKTW